MTYMPVQEEKVLFGDGKYRTMQTFSVCGEKLASILLECPYDNLNDPAYTSYFLDLVRLKLAGYQNKYGYGILPFDGHDLIANHYTVCMIRNGKPVPIMGMKSVTLERCRTHKVSFPMGEFYSKPEFADYRKAIENLIAAHDKRPGELGYNGSFTISPEVRNNRELVKEIRDIGFSYIVQYYRDYKIPTQVAVALVPFKVPESKRQIGWDTIKLNGRPLPPTPCDFFFGEEIALMVGEKENEGGRALAKKYEQMWNARLTLGESKLETIKKAA